LGKDSILSSFGQRKLPTANAPSLQTYLNGQPLAASQQLQLFVSFSLQAALTAWSAQTSHSAATSSRISLNQNNCMQRFAPGGALEHLKCGSCGANGMGGADWLQRWAVQESVVYYIA
jgi:hypothetical protein